jgi:ribonuclease G
MANILVINSTSHENRVALVEDGIISEFHIERKRDRGIVGNVYKGRVLRVLPGMQASFIDIGQEKAAFLYVADVFNLHQDLSLSSALPALQKGGRVRTKAPIEERLEEGQHVLVQVAKDPIGTKGARVTSHISLPGRYLVYMPTVDHVGISRRIEDEEERRRLRDIVEAHRPPGTGFIVRTACEGVPDRYLQNDMEMLIGLWREILSKRDSVQPPSQLYAEPDLILRAARDLFTTDLHRMVLDREEDHRRVVGFAERFMPKAVQQIELYTGREPVFDAYGIELEISRALSRKVWLKSGGYIVIDHTEAMTCVDVNTGRYVGDTSLEETIVRINLEAVEEIVYQLRLRGIGGLIILDFIDMERPGNRELVFDALQKALLTDKVKTHALPISEFGLVEMTRKRVRESIVQFLCEECPYCEGKGHVKSRETVAYEIMRELLREASALAGEELTVQANPEVIAVLTEQEREALKTIERGASKTIHLVPNRAFHVEQYELATDV